MRRAMQFLGALVAAVLLHFVATRFFVVWPLVLDLMLLVVVFNALDGNTLGGMVGGLVAGWATDALVGSTFGLFGLVDTIVGYGVAFAVQRVVIQRMLGAAALFAVASLCQQGLLFGLGAMLLPASEIPAYHWLLIKAGTTGLLGAMLFYARQSVADQVDLWRHTRKTRIRLER
jgi:rod shape-determining protein MreD